MPEISRFFGIIIRMFAEPGAPHHRPHFHAYYQNHQAVFSIDTIAIMGGNLPQREKRLVEAWVELHQGETFGKLAKVAVWRNAVQSSAAPITQEIPMEHPIYRVLDFEIVAPHTLRILFNDGTEQVIDFRPILAGELYEPLQDERLFNQVEIDPEVHTLVWPNGADFDPATLHDWPEYVGSMKKLARQWKTVKAEVV